MSANPNHPTQGSDQIGVQKVALVTGAGSGLGAATVIAFTDAGYRVAALHARYRAARRPKTRPSDTRMDSPTLTERRVAALQAAFYISTGVWPLLHRHSFERLTGPKVDFWLAQTVGATVAAIGAGGMSRRRSTAALKLGASPDGSGPLPKGRARPAHVQARPRSPTGWSRSAGSGCTCPAVSRHWCPAW